MTTMVELAQRALCETSAFVNYGCSIVAMRSRSATELGTRKAFGGCDTKSAEGAIDMLSNDDIDCLLAIGEQQRAELLAPPSDLSF